MILNRFFGFLLISFLMFSCNSRHIKEYTIDDIGITYSTQNVRTCLISLPKEVHFSLSWENKLHVWRMIKMYDYNIRKEVDTKLITKDVFLVLYFFSDGTIIIGGPSCKECAISTDSFNRILLINDSIKEDICVNFQENSYRIYLSDSSNGINRPFEKALVLKSSFSSDSLSVFVYKQ